MKHRELIIAAMDGKQIQWRHYGYPTWNTASNIEGAIHALVSPSEHYEYRIKPEPVPDKVQWGVISARCEEASVRDWMGLKISNGKPAYSHMVKLTTKTDDNGVVTEHVEIVK